MRRILASALVLAGCDSVFGLSVLPLTDASKVGDSGVGDSVGDSGATDATADSSPDAVTNNCPANYGAITGLPYAYRYISTPTSWTSAQALCVTDHDTIPQSVKQTHLAVLETDLQGSALAAYNNSAVDIWLGFTDRIQQGSFTWVTDQSIAPTPPWAAGEPSTTLDHCVVQLRDAQYDARNCNNLYAFFCQCDDFTDKPPANY